MASPDRPADNDTAPVRRSPADHNSSPVHDSPGHDSPGHDSPDHHSPDHDSPGHDSPGHDSPGHDSPDHRSPAAGSRGDPPTAKKRKRSPEPDSASDDDAPPLPTGELPPPLPNEVPPAQQDDGWEALWDAGAHAYYFHNRRTAVTQWDNPRVPQAGSSAAVPPAPGTSAAHGATTTTSLGSPPRKRLGGYNPAVHGDYDPNADYAQEYRDDEEPSTLDPNAAAAMHAAALGDPAAAYAQTASFNRFTGRFQPGALGPEQHNDENKSRRQLNAYFDVDAAANSHDGRSLKAERQNKKLSKKELKAFREKAAKKKDEKRRAWLRD